METDVLEGGHRVLHLQEFASPSLVADLWRHTQLADMWGLSTPAARGTAPQKMPERLALRCLEAIEYQGASGHSLGFHHDGDTHMTVSIMLSAAGDFEGGDFEIRRKLRPAGDLAYEKHRAERGDLLVWRGWDDHRVTPLVRGRRRVLAAEWRCCSAEDDSRPGEGRPDDSLTGFFSALRHDQSAAILHFALVRRNGPERLED